MQRLVLLILGVLATASMALVADRCHPPPSVESPDRGPADGPDHRLAKFDSAPDGLPTPTRRVTLDTYDARGIPTLGGRGLFSATSERQAYQRACRRRNDRDVWYSKAFALNSLQSVQVRIQT